MKYLYFVAASFDLGDENGPTNFDFFVRARAPRHAYRFWRENGWVTAHLPLEHELPGAILIWHVPSVDGPEECIGWWGHTPNWMGSSAEDFPVFHTTEDRP
jgi:hypothetical protein